jgi:hypothetical protein
MTTQVISGSAQGAQAGYKTSGTWQGAVVGAIVGAVGGIFGDKAAKYRRKANNEEQRALDIQQQVQRRQLVRSVYLARASALAAGASQETGGIRSSAVQGAVSSIGSQGISNIKYFDSLVARQIVQKYYLKKAKKNQDISDLIGGLVQGAGSSGGGMMGGGGGGGGGSTSSTSGTSDGGSLSNWGGGNTGSSGFGGTYGA